MVRFLNSKTKAFTIMELMVVMVISSIVVLSALEFYVTFQKMMTNKDKEMNSSKELLLFYEALKNDMEGAITARFNADRIIFTPISGNLVKYELREDEVLRHQSGITDTFHVEPLKHRFDNDPVTGNGRLIELEIKTNKELYTITLEKSETNDVLLNSSVDQKQTSDGY